MRQRARRETNLISSGGVLINYNNGGLLNNSFMRGDVAEFNGLGCSASILGTMGPIKSFGDLQDSILKLRENFDAIVMGKHLIMPESPLKKKDLMNEFAGGASIIGGGSLKEQECETDEEEEGEFKKEKIKERTNSIFSQIIS